VSTTSDGTRLRLARLARRLSQHELAASAGVTRQAVAGIEAGRWDPSLRVALALARALAIPVEDLFGPGEPPPALEATPLGPLGPAGSRVAFADVGGRRVALPLREATAARAGFVAAGALASDEPNRIRPLGIESPRLIVAGCDPALPLLEEPLGRLDPPIGLVWWPCGSRQALELVAEGLVHAAGIHLRDARGEYNLGPAKLRFLPGASEGGSEVVERSGADVIGFASWREGLVVRPELGPEVAGLADAAQRGLRVVNREPGSEAHAVLERARLEAGLAAGDLDGYTTSAKGHLQVADAIAAGLGDLGVASEPAALAYGLEFLPLADERYDLVVRRRPDYESKEVLGLLRVLASRWLRTQLESIPGYDSTPCGEVIGSF
jgi:molybdate-binding protein/DNA-binding XRE family transcriptional regulator